MNTIKKEARIRSPLLLNDKTVASETYTDPSWSQSGFANMEELRRMGKLCDITLIAQDEKFSAHRIVLAASIPYFKAMFTHDYMLESRQDSIHISQVVDSCALEHIINYSYNGRIEISNENVQSLLIAANFFNLKSIKEACCEFVKKRISVQDALCLRSFAEQLMCHDLVVFVNRFINNNFSKIIQTNEFLSLSVTEMSDILNRDDLSVDSEEQVYEALLTWVKHAAETREKYLFQLLQLVRLPLIGPFYLVENISNESLVKNNFKCRDLLDEAIYYHLLPEKRPNYKTFNLKPRCCNDSFGLLYCIGGISSSGGSVSVVEVYDCVNDKWRFAETMNLNRSRVAVAVLNGRLYTIGGYNGLERLSTVEYFEPSSKRWQKVCPISKPRSALGLAVLNNRLYVCGGYDGFASCDTVEMYDPKVDKWKILSSMRKHRSASGITAFNSMIYAAGGHDGYRIYDSVECYDTQKDQWSYVASMKTKRCRLGLAALNGKLYAAGGYDSLNFLNTVERYCPIEDKWEFVAPMNFKRSRLALVTCNSKLFAIGGYDGSQNLCSMEAYEPEKDRWVIVSSMQSNQGVVGVGVLAFELDLGHPYEEQDNHQQQEAAQTRHQQQREVYSKRDITNKLSIPAKRLLPVMNNYYSLMEDEDDENSNLPTTTASSSVNHNNNDNNSSNSNNPNRS